MSFYRNVTLLVVVLMVTMSCGDARQSELVGQWRDRQGTTIEFFEDGTFIFAGQAGTYSIPDNGRLKIVSPRVSDVFEYTIDGDAFVTTDSEGIRTTFTRISRDR